MYITSERRDHDQRREAKPTGGIRQAVFGLRDAADSGLPDDGWTLDGYGAVFNSLTTIDSWEGTFREQIASGSMKKSFRENPPIVQFDHGRHPLIGSLPIADVKSIREDTDPELAPDGGAHIQARIFQHLFFEPLRDAIAAKAIKGMSFRFEVVREKWQYADGKPIKNDEDLMVELRRTWSGDVEEQDLPVRTLQELRVPEMGPVVWPAYNDTSVSVRHRIIDLGALRNNPSQRKELAKAFIAADVDQPDWAAERATWSEKMNHGFAHKRPVSQSERQDADDDVIAMIGALDAVLDSASGLLVGVDLSTLPPDVAQACNLLVAAEVTADELMELVGADDPDDDEPGESETNSRKNVGEERKSPGTPQATPDASASRAGKHLPNDAPRTTRSNTDRAGEHPSKPKNEGTHRLSREERSDVMKRTRDVLLQTKKG
jgi:phage head maturation protease